MVGGVQNSRTTPWTRISKYVSKISNGHHAVEHGRALVRHANVQQSGAGRGAGCTAD